MLRHGSEIFNRRINAAREAHVRYDATRVSCDDFLTRKRMMGKQWICKLTFSTRFFFFTFFRFTFKLFNLRVVTTNVISEIFKFRNGGSLDSEKLNIRIIRSIIWKLNFQTLTRDLSLLKYLWNSKSESFVRRLPDLEKYSIYVVSKRDRRRILRSEIFGYSDILDMWKRCDLSTRWLSMHSTSSTALLRARPIRARLASFQFFDGGIPLSARRGLITRLEDYGGSEGDAKAIDSRMEEIAGDRRRSRIEAGIEAARIPGSDAVKLELFCIISD